MQSGIGIAVLPDYLVEELRQAAARVVVTEETVRDNVLPTLVPREVETPKRRVRKESA